MHKYKIILFQPGNDAYAFVEFVDHVTASAALAILNQRLFLEKVCNVYCIYSAIFDNYVIFPYYLIY